MISRKGFLTGLGLGGASAVGAAALFAEKAAASTCEYNTDDEFVSVLGCGANGRGETNDAAAIQAALATGKHVYFPPGTYRVDSAVTITKPDQMLFSDAAYGSVAPTIVSTINNGPAIVVAAHQAVFHGLRIEGPGRNTEALAIRCKK